MPHATITETGQRPPVTTQAPDEGVAVGDYITGTCVTMNRQRVGQVVEISPPLKYSGQYGNRYAIVGDDLRTHWVDQPRKLGPVAAAGVAVAQAMRVDGYRPADVAAAALEAARAAGASTHLAGRLAAAAAATALDAIESA